MTCAKIWVCPICAARIAHKRRRLLAYLVGKLSALGKRHTLVTYTLAHQRDDDLSTVKKALQEAYTKSKEGRAYQTFAKEYGIIGSIRTLEITHGDNGWHPHIHELLIHSADVSPETLHENIYPRYLAALNKQGRHALAKGLDVKASDDDVYEYISKYGHLPLSKWSLAHEMTAQARKEAKLDHRSSMQILYDLMKKGNHSDRWLWIELEEATRNTAMMFISRAVRKLVNVPQLNDELDAQDAAKEPDDSLFADLHLSLWDLVSDKQQRWQVLTLANESQTFDEFNSKMSAYMKVNIVSTNFYTEKVTVIGGGVGRGVGEGMLDDVH
jgi:hypothetical protein